MECPEADFRGRATLVNLALAALILLSCPAPALAGGEAHRSEPEASEPHPAVAAAREWHGEHGPAILREFASLLAIPNVASDTENINANARAIAHAFAERGAEMELLTLPAEPTVPPVVFGSLPAEEGAEAAPTLVLYVHYDGQPVDEAAWHTPPWEPTLFTAARDAGGEARALPADGDAPHGETLDPEWRLYARSAGDDKAPLAALLAAVDALKAAGVPRRVNVKFFFDGEEEAGSPHLARYVRRYAERLESDAWMFLDGPVHQSGRPQLFFGVRGYAGLDVTVYGADRYLHSGHYGNWAPNPGVALAHLVASMKAPDGRVLVDGFYDSAEPLGEAERRALAAVPEFEPALRRELGLAEDATEGGPGVRYGERIALPALNLRGMASATVGESARNVIPPSATASFDLRLVAGDDPEAMQALVEEHVRRQGYHLVRDEPDAETRRRHAKLARVVRRDGYRAVRTAMDLPASRRAVAAARAAADSSGMGELVLLPTLGGSLPLYVVEDHLEVPLVGVPIANHDNNQHAPDENIRVANLLYGIDLFAALLAGAE